MLIIYNNFTISFKVKKCVKFLKLKFGRLKILEELSLFQQYQEKDYKIIENY